MQVENGLDVQVRQQYPMAGLLRLMSGKQIGSHHRSKAAGDSSGCRGDKAVHDDGHLAPRCAQNHARYGGDFQTTGTAKNFARPGGLGKV